MDTNWFLNLLSHNGNSSVPVFMPIPYCFDAIVLEYSSKDASSFVLFQACSGYLGPLVGPYKLHFFVVVSLRKILLEFLEIALSLWIALGNMDILTIFSQ